MAADFRFYGTIEIDGDDFDVNVLYKTDATDAEDCSFTVAYIGGLDEEEVLLFDKFKKLTYDVPSFVKFAKDNNLNLVAWVGQDSPEVVLNTQQSTTTTTSTTSGTTTTTTTSGTTTTSTTSGTTTTTTTGA